MKILIVEDPQVVPVVIDFLKNFEKIVCVPMEPIIATSDVEAEARLAECDIAIIYVMGVGRPLIKKALVETNIPTVITSFISDKIASLLVKREKIRYLAKPRYDLQKLARFLQEFMKIIQVGEQIKTEGPVTYLCA